jgi:quinohemoprotein ethanol dehydrogenase
VFLERWNARHCGDLVFQGTGDGNFKAYKATNGEKLWTFYAGLGINAAPMTYAIDGVQYVAVLVGYGGTINITRVRDYGWRYGEQPRRLLAFALGKSTGLPPGKPPRFTVQAIDDPSFIIDTKLAAAGAKMYDNCAGCHGIEMRNIASFARDLRESAVASTWAGFKSVVQGGSFFSLGMPRFDDLSEQDLRALYMYIRQQARTAAH